MKNLICFPLSIRKRHGSSQQLDWIITVSNKLPTEQGQEQVKYLITKARGRQKETKSKANLKDLKFQL